MGNCASLRRVRFSYRNKTSLNCVSFCVFDVGNENNLTYILRNSFPNLNINSITGMGALIHGNRSIIIDSGMGRHMSNIMLVPCKNMANRISRCFLNVSMEIGLMKAVSVSMYLG